MCRRTSRAAHADRCGIQADLIRRSADRNKRVFSTGTSSSSNVCQRNTSGVAGHHLVFQRPERLPLIALPVRRGRFQWSRVRVRSSGNDRITKELPAALGRFLPCASNLLLQCRVVPRGWQPLPNARPQRAQTAGSASTAHSAAWGTDCHQRRGIVDQGASASIRWDGVRHDKDLASFFKKRQRHRIRRSGTKPHSRRQEKTTTAGPVGAVRFLADEGVRR